MIPTPIPDAEIWEGARRMVIAPPDGDFTSDDIRAVEALVDVTELGKRFSMRCLPEPGEVESIRAGAPIWVQILGEQLQPFALDVGEAPASGPWLRLDVDWETEGGLPRFDAQVCGVPDDGIRTFVEGCVEALQKMLDTGLTPPPAT